MTYTLPDSMRPEPEPGSLKIVRMLPPTQDDVEAHLERRARSEVARFELSRPLTRTESVMIKTLRSDWEPDLTADEPTLVVHTDSLEATPGARLDQIIGDLAITERIGRERREQEDAEWARRQEIADRVNEQIAKRTTSRQLGRQDR